MKVGGALYSIGGMPTAMSNMCLCHPKSVFFEDFEAYHVGLQMLDHIQILMFICKHTCTLIQCLRISYFPKSIEDQFSREHNMF